MRHADPSASTPAAQVGLALSPEDGWALDALRPYLRRLLRSRHVDENEVDDMIEDIVFAVVRRWSEFDRTQPDALRRWLNGFARNAIGDYIRRPRRVMVPLRPEHATVPGHEGQVEARDMLCFLAGRLPAEHWDILVGRIDTTAAELAAERNEPRSTTEWRTREARAALARVVAREASPPSRNQVSNSPT